MKLKEEKIYVLFSWATVEKNKLYGDENYNNDNLLCFFMFKWLNNLYIHTSYISISSQKKNIINYYTNTHRWT